MGKLNFNESALRHLARHRPPDREGRLLYRTSSDSYRERWFRLCGNLLFYFRTNEMGSVADVSDPLGVLVLAQCHAQIEQFGDRPFVFSVAFDGEEKRKYYFSGQTQRHCDEWVGALRNCLHSSLKAQLETLRLRIQQITGCDPLSNPVLEMNWKKTKQKSPSLPPPPVNHRAATFYVEPTLDVKGRNGFTSFFDKPAGGKLLSKCPVPISQLDTAKVSGKPASTKQSVHTNNSWRDAGVEAVNTNDIKVELAETSSFSSWEKFN